jgi:hypothetical protein
MRAMSRVAQYLKLIDDPRSPPLVPGDPADEPLLALLVHLANEDGVLQSDELALLHRVRPDLDDDGVRRWVAEVAGRPFDLGALAEVAPTPEERLDVLRFAARMVCLDGEITLEERGGLDEIARRLHLGIDAPQAALDEIVARGGPVPEKQVRAALRNMFWDVLLPSRDDLASTLAGVVPTGLAPVCSIHLGADEVAGLFVEGLAGRFDEGPAFLRWSEIVAYTRVPVPGAAFHLRAADGRTLAMSDPRLRDVGALLDFIYGRAPVPR